MWSFKSKPKPRQPREVTYRLTTVQTLEVAYLLDCAHSGEWRTNHTARAKLWAKIIEFTPRPPEWGEALVARSIETDDCKIGYPVTLTEKL